MDQRLIEICTRIPGYWYLATPYSKYPEGLEMAFVEACRVAGHLIKIGVRVFSPIAHMHPVARFCNIDPHDHAIWLPADRPIMDAACGLIVCKMPSWEISFGIAEEIKIFEAAGKPIEYMEWPPGP